MLSQTVMFVTFVTGVFSKPNFRTDNNAHPPPQSNFKPATATHRSGAQSGRRPAGMIGKNKLLPVQDIGHYDDEAV